MTCTKALLAAVVAVLGFGAGDALADPITNGDFESGVTGFTSGYGHSPTDYTPAGVFDVNTSPALHHGLFSDFAAHDGVNMMIVNGADTPGVVVWASTTSVEADTTYYFSAWVASAHPASPAQLNFSINGSAIGTTFTASSTTGLWQQFYATWYSGSSTTANLSIVNQNTAFGGNDFALDSLVLGTLQPGGTNTSLVPEPASGLLLLAGLGAMRLAVARRRRR